MKNITKQLTRTQRVRDIVPDYFSVTQAMQVLGRSRRQLYRYIKDGLLDVSSRMGTYYFLNAERVRGLKHQLVLQNKRGSLPPSGKILFPEYSLKSLHPHRHGTVVLARVLERGTFRDIRWAMDFYTRDTMRIFLRDHGTRLLSSKSLHFWSWYLQMEVPVPSKMRRMGQELGGAA